MSGDNPTNRELGIQIESLTKLTENKFDGVIQHLSDLNGSVKMNTTSRLRNEGLLEDIRADRHDRLKRYSDLIWKLAVIGLAAVFGIDKIV